ncbi:MAG: nitroreductase family protein, partial [Prevotellaceae bacterium]|nr:nitroreductase family protein [Prevotellaceae bacterium]
MKKKSFFNILLCSLALAVIIPACGNGKSAGNETLSVIAERKSVRSFTSQAVSDEDVQAILKAGMAAPSARNLQPWELVVITDRAVLDALAAQLPYAKMLA